MYSFMDCAFGVICKRFLSNPNPLSFSSRSYIILYFTFSFMNHFELTFVKLKNRFVSLLLSGSIDSM